MEIGKEIIQILLPGLDDENCISVDDAMQLLEQAEFDLDGIGVTDNEDEGLIDILGDLDSFFEILTNEDQNIIKCKVIPKQQEEQQPIFAQQAEQNPEEIAKLYNQFANLIKSLQKFNSYPQGYIHLSKIGKEMKKQGLVLPPGETVSSFLSKKPSVFEMKDEPSGSGSIYVRLNLKKEVVKQEPASLAISQPNVNEPIRTISIYNLYDFVYFSNYNDVKRQLAEMAVEDEWFVLPDDVPGDKYILLHYKLYKQFAMLVKEQLSGNKEGIKLGLTDASFDSGFITPSGQHIIACLRLNKQRGNSRLQIYEFDKFRVED